MNNQHNSPPEGGWTVHMHDGTMGPYPTWQAAVAAARGPLAPGVTGIWGPEGTVPLTGAALAHKLGLPGLGAAPAHPEPLAPVELVQLIVSGARTLTSRIHRLDDAAVAVQVSAILDEVVAACQQLQGRALAIADSDSQVEAEAVFDAVMSRLDGEGGDQR